MKLLPLLLLLLVAGCQRGPADPKEYAVSLQTDTNSAAGRYMALPAGKDDVWRINTVTGDLEYCWHAVVTKQGQPRIAVICVSE